MANNYLDKNANLTLNDIVSAELVRNGVDPDQESLLGVKGIMTQAIQYLFDNIRVIQEKNQRNNNLLETTSVSHLCSQLVQNSDEPKFAEPSKIKLNISIPVEYIKQMGKPIGQLSSWEFEYKNTNSVILDNKPFMIDKDSYFVRVTEKGSDIDVRVYYKNKSNVNVYVTAQKIMLAPKIYTVVFEANFLQQTVEVIEKTFVSGDLDEFVFVTQNYISSFKVEYRDNDSEPWRKIDMLLYYKRGISDTLRYDYMSDKSIRVSHQYNSGGFKPIKGGVLRATFYTTIGEDINFSGNPLPGNVVPKGAPYSYLSVEDNGSYISAGGRSATSNVDELRSTTIKMKSTRRRIDTEPDMEAWLLPYTGASKFKPKLLINDIKDRIWNIYTMLKFDQIVAVGETQTFTIPTNSGDLLVNLEEVPSKFIDGFKSYCINSSMLIESQQNTELSTFTLKPSGEFVPDTESRGTYYYVTPFIHSYVKKDSILRTYMDSQFNKSYPTLSEFESDDERIFTRFINTNIRVSDYMNDEGERVYQIYTLLRADDNKVELDNKNLSVALILNDTDDDPFEIKGSIHKEPNEEGANLYRIIFDVSTNRNIFDRFIEVTYKDSKERDGSKMINVNQKAKLKVSLFIEDNWVEVTRYNCDLQLFIEITNSLYIQTNEEYDSRLNLLLCPMVSYQFYQLSKNQRVILDELENVYKFIESEVYEKDNTYASRGYKLNDILETLYTVSIKFVKTYGCSSFLNVGNTVTTPLINLQVKPKLYISKIDNDFDVATISNIFNNEFMAHNFIEEDLHMSVLISAILANTNQYINALQFVNFGNYPSDYHTIKNNGKDEKNDDVPEVLSIGSKYNEELDRYEYDITFSDLE